MMLAPRVIAKELDQAEPGELIRTSGRSGPILGLVAKWHVAPDAKLLVCLPGEQGGDPYYMPIAPGSGAALSFGREYVIVGDPGAEAVDARWHGDFYGAGALIIAGERALLQIAPISPGYQFGDIFYDIEAGCTVGDVRPPGCVLLKWEIRLTAVPELDPPLSPIFHFELPSRPGR